MEPVTIALTAAALLGGYAAWLEIKNARANAMPKETAAAPIQTDYQKQLATYLAQPATTPTPGNAPSDSTKQGYAGVAGVAGVGLAPGATSAVVAGAAYGGIAAAAAGFASAAKAHHAAGILNEAHNLNGAVPVFFQNVDLILKGVIAKQLDSATAKAMIDRSTQIYLETVTNTGPQAGNADQFAGAIEMGPETQSLTGINAMVLKTQRAAIIAALIKKWMNTPMKQGPGRAKPSDSVPSYIPADATPKPCNGPCVVFRDNILPTAYRAKIAVGQIASGQHGSMTALQTFANSYGFAGYPETTWAW